MDYKQLIAQAAHAKQFAYTPYYKFRVGAALLSQSGKVFTGCNVESAAGASICAERVALTKAVSEGEKEFVAIAISGDGEDFLFPCGICRQHLVEFSPEMLVICHDINGNISKTKLSELLPHHFGPNSLN